MSTSARNTLVTIIALLACSPLLSGCQISTAAGMRLPEQARVAPSRQNQATLQLAEDLTNAPAPPISPALPAIVPIFQRLAAQAREVEARNAEAQRAEAARAQVAQKNERPARPRVPLEHYLTAAALVYPDPPPSWGTTENFLIMGTDKRDGEPSWRTDVMMLVGLDRDGGRAAVMSIPRDLYVTIPGVRTGRINTLDYLGEKVLRIEGGGALLVAHVIRKQFGIDVKHWVRVEMDGLSELVDALGGVTVHLECPFFEPILNLDTNSWEYFTLPAGEVTIDGDDARWFVRLRLRESDIGRSKRQRQFLSALQNQMLSTNGLIRLPELWRTMSDMYETDLGLFQTMDLVRVALSIDGSAIRSGGLSGKNGALENFRTESGAQVLRILSESAVHQAFETVWSGESIASSNVPISSASTGCPPIPTGPPSNPYGR